MTEERLKEIEGYLARQDMLLGLHCRELVAEVRRLRMEVERARAYGYIATDDIDDYVGGCDDLGKTQKSQFSVTPPRFRVGNKWVGVGFMEISRCW